jgi:serine protease SohB
MEYLAEYLLFLAKTLTVVGGVAALAALVSSRRARMADARAHIRVHNLNRKYAQMEHTLRFAMLSRKGYRQFFKSWKRESSARQQTHPDKPTRERVFVIDFHGDIRASAVASLREEVTAILTVATPEDEVVVRLESGGGLVHAYGLAASQIERLKAAGVHVTVAVDKVAASGGYMMACVADRLLAAPFAILGSIGVIAQTPNLHRLLKKHDIDFEQFTAGEYKRTVTVFGENTDEGRAKFREQIEEVHTLFKDFVARHRPVVDVAQVATGEHWYGQQALQHKLADELRTSDDYLLEASRTKDIYQVTHMRRKTALERWFGGGGHEGGTPGGLV